MPGRREEGYGSGCQETSCDLHRSAIFENMFPSQTWVKEFCNVAKVVVSTGPYGSFTKQAGPIHIYIYIYIQLYSVL